jgi:hypothetical protein
MRSHSAVALFDLLRGMELPPGSFAVFGSGPLAARGLIEEVGDLDVVVRDDAWDRLKGLGTIIEYGDNKVVDLGNGLTFGRTWAYGDFDVDQLIDDAEVIGYLPFVRLDAVLEFKRIASRPKDLHHIELIVESGLV